MIHLTNLWHWLFKFKLYDFLIMTAYQDSIAATVKTVTELPHQNILEIGCGTGLLLEQLAKTLHGDCRYTGIDLSSVGVQISQKRSSQAGISRATHFLVANVCNTIPVPTKSQDIAISHFSLYVLPDDTSRIQALKNIAVVIKPHGKLLLTVPNIIYRPKQQVKTSLTLDQARKISPFTRAWHWLKFNTLGWISEIIVARKIKKGTWKGYTKESLMAELKAAGFKAEWIKDTYGNTAYFAQCALE